MPRCKGHGPRPGTGRPRCLVFLFRSWEEKPKPQTGLGVLVFLVFFFSFVWCWVLNDGQNYSSLSLLISLLSINGLYIIGAIFFKKGT